MLRIGIKKAFTLIEVMAAACVLALGTVLIYEAYFICLDGYNYYSNYLNVAAFADEKIWEAQDSLTHFASLQGLESKGEFTYGSRRFIWDLSYELLDKMGQECQLFKVDLKLSWREGKRVSGISRSTYALYERQ
jgi:prepilin-type N-terminal cleavage/methylation domain-containing protein